MSGIQSLTKRAITVINEEGLPSLMRRARWFVRMRMLSVFQKVEMTKEVYYDRFGSTEYWERRYADDRPSGPGSEGEYAQYKAEILNDFVKVHDIETVLEFGCGDGRQVELADYPEYTGLEVSESAVEQCTQKFSHDPSKSFLLYEPFHSANKDTLTAELVLSLEVVFHLVEDEVFEKTMHDMFDAAERYVIIFSSNHEESTPELHIRHRNFTEYVEQEFPNFELIETFENEYEERLSDFYLYEKVGR
jgi:cyclopropane fatty-acyl-phospholipid synthase-like methyltransferase